MLFFQMSDMALFMCILFVFVAGFGIAYHANLFPNAPADWAILRNVFYYPYFQMYGELFLDVIQGETGRKSSTTLL
jgi:transient receptor potential cation channel subfamily M protein 2